MDWIGPGAISRDWVLELRDGRQVVIPPHKGSLKQHLYQGAEKKNYDGYQDSILENRKPEKETSLKVGLDEFRATNYTGYFYATSNKLLTPTNDLQF